MRVGCAFVALTRYRFKPDVTGWDSFPPLTPGLALDICHDLLALVQASFVHLLRMFLIHYMRAIRVAIVAHDIYSSTREGAPIVSPGNAREYLDHRSD